MCILIDPTEARHRTRLPQAVIKQSVVLPGLEALTGADLLVTLSKSPNDVRKLAGDPQVSTIRRMAQLGQSVRHIAEKVDKPLPFVLNVLRFENACRNGILAQRKTGRDACSIIPNSHGAVILEKMITWCPECWLVFVDAEVGCNRAGKMTVNGKAVGYLYNQFSGATDAWKRRGGFVKWLPGDNNLMGWLSKQLDCLRTRTDEKVLALRQPLQCIVGPDDNEARKIAILASLRHVGVGKARQLLDYYDGNLAAALVAVLDPGIVKFKDKPKGIGKVTVGDNRLLFGLSESWMRLSVVAESPKET